MIWLLGGYMWLFVHRPFEIYTILGTLQIERAYMILMLVCWLASPRKKLEGNRLHLALACFSLAMVVCWALSPYRDVTADVLEIYLKVMVFYFLVVTSVRDETDLRRLVALFLVAVGVYMTHSALEYLHGRHQWRMGVSRMVGVDITYGDPNNFASTLVLTLPLTVPFWRTARGGRRLLLAGYCACVAGCVMLTGSRGGFVGLVAAALLVSWSSRYRARALCLVSVAGLAGVVLLPGSLQDRFLSLIDSSRGPTNAQRSAEGRLKGLEDGLRLWERNPLTGIGPLAFVYASGRGYNPHNLYGQVLGEMGTLGVLAFAGLLLAFRANVREARRLCARAPATDTAFAADVSRGVGTSILLLLLFGCAGHNLYRYNWLWLAAVQVVAVHCLRHRAARMPSRPRTWQGWSACPLEVA